MRLLVLGPPRLERAGQPVDLGLRRAVALLVYLAVTDRPQGRETLAGLLWPDSDEQEARGRLRRTLHRLADAIGDDVLLAEADTLRLAPGADLWLDSRAFDQHAAAGLAQAQEAATSESERLEHLTTAAELYEDDFLAGFSLPGSPAWDEWQFLERERLRRTCARVLGRLVRAHREQGAYEAAIGYARRRLALDPLHEPAHRTLMKLYALTGQPAAALRQYQECTRLLEAELGVPPEEETTKLYEAIKRRRLAPPSRPDPARTLTAPTAEGPQPAVPISGLAGPPPPLRQNLPPQLTSFIGRDREQESIAARLMAEDTRLLTLTGPGGVGKTRLALEVASDLVGRFEDGVCLVTLAPVTDPGLVGSAIAQALGVREVPGRRLLDSIRDSLRHKQVLLLLDNFEHLLTAAPLVADLLVACPRLKILVTSRSALHLRGEREFAVPPLMLPEREQILSLEALAQVPTVALFTERARDVRPDFAITVDNAADVAEICRRLDGLPLAIELAAARVKALTPATILARLERRLALLTGGPRDLPVRQQTLRDTIAWSYDLLAKPERTVFGRLAVFVGGCDLEAAEAVCQPSSSPGVSLLDALGSLVDNSLVRQDEPAGQSRFWMLETIREYALERLEESGDAEQVKRRHAEYYLTLAERAELELHGPRQVAWLDVLEGEHDNLRAALAWCRQHREAEVGLRLVGALRWFWQMRGHWCEGRDWTEEMLRLSGPSERTTTRAKALCGGGVLAWQYGHFAAARARLIESMDICRELGDRAHLTEAMQILAVVAWSEGDQTRAETLAAECLAIFRAANHTWGVALVLGFLGRIALQRGDYTAAAAALQESVRNRREVGDIWVLAENLNSLADVARCQGDYAAAGTYYGESLALARELGSKGTIAILLHNLGYVALHEGDAQHAEALFGESLALFRELGDEPGMAECVAGLGAVAGADGRLNEATQLLGAAEAALEARGASVRASNRGDHDRNLTAVRAKLDDATFAQAWAAGRTMTLDEATTLALRKVPTA